MKLPGPIHRTMILAAAALAAAGCATFRPRPPLRVGVAPDFPPVIMKQEGQIEGLEADMALLLADRLKRRLEFVEVRWSELVPRLLAGDIDIIMSGMSVTRARQIRVDFCNPYLKTGLMVLVRRADAGTFGSREALLDTDATIGVLQGTTGEIFVRENCPNARAVQYAEADDAALGLRDRRIDAFVCDAPAVFWLASKYESELAVESSRLTEELLAWAVRADNGRLKTAANEMLAGWEKDGTLVALLDRWMRHLR